MMTMKKSFVWRKQRNNSQQCLHENQQSQECTVQKIILLCATYDISDKQFLREFRRIHQANDSSIEVLLERHIVYLMQITTMMISS